MAEKDQANRRELSSEGGGPLNRKLRVAIEDFLELDPQWVSPSLEQNLSFAAIELKRMEDRTGARWG
jgi:hypothetical protein